MTDGRKPEVGKTFLHLLLDAAATPDRVARAAEMFAEVMDVFARIPEGSITVVVDNLNMDLGIRAQNEQGKEFLDLFALLIANPIAAVQETPELREVAGALASYARDAAADGPRFMQSRRKKPIAILDATFADVMDAAASSTPEPADTLRGRTHVFSAVYRVGRLDVSKKLTARLRLDDTPRDIEVPDELADAFFDAAKSGATYKVQLDAQWLRSSEGDLRLNSRRTRAVGIEPFSALSGREFLDALEGSTRPTLAETAAFLRTLDEDN